MSISNSRQSYQDCYTLMDQAIEDALGIRVQVVDRGAAVFLRMRLHNARKINRRDNGRLFDEEHPMHGASLYDKLMVRINEEGDEVWVHLEKTDVVVGKVESLSGGTVNGVCLHCDKPSVTNLDGDNLCKEHADAWVQSEGEAAAEIEMEEAEAVPVPTVWRRL